MSEKPGGKDQNATGGSLTAGVFRKRTRGGRNFIYSTRSRDANQSHKLLFASSPSSMTVNEHPKDF